MYFKNLAALVGMISLVAAAPASRDGTPMERGLKHKPKRAIIIEQQIQETQITVINQNLDKINQLELIAEQNLAAAVQAQLALISTVETIKNNIRVNHFKNRWNQVNTVIVTVTQVIDQRDPKNINNRYLMNQLQADNGAQGQEILVFVTAQDNIVIGATPTQAVVPGVAGVGTAISAPTSAPNVQNIDPNNPFGQSNGAVLLPFGTTPPQAPSAAQVFADPAAIILPNQNLFVGDTTQIQQDCALIAAGSLFNLQSQLLASQQAIAQAQLAGLVLGQQAPPTVIVNVGGGGNVAAAPQAAARI